MTTSKPRRSSGDTVETRITERLTERIGSHKYDMWFGHTQFSTEGNRLAVATDSQFVANWIDQHFASDLRGAAVEAMGDDVQIDVHVAPEVFGRTEERTVAGDEPTARKSKGSRRKAAPAKSPARKPLMTRRLDDFVMGRANKLALSASRRLVDDEDPNLVSPLFMHGDCGVGKTHLLLGICDRFRKSYGPNVKVRYLTGEQFTNEYIAAIRTSTLEEFRARMRKLDLLAIDDVHFLANKVRTQCEFLHTLDAIDLAGARIALAADEHPRHIKRFSQALISRFLSGMVVQIERPDRETRMELIRRLAGLRGLSMNETAVEAIAARYVSSVRELEGAVTKLAALRTLMNGSATGDVGAVLTNQLLADQSMQPAMPVRITTVIDVVCDRLGISQVDLMGSGRHRRVVLGRALVAYLSRELTTQSYPEIAQALGRTYHSTVHTAAQRLRRQLDANEQIDLGGTESIDLRELVDELRHAVLRATAGKS